MFDFPLTIKRVDGEISFTLGPVKNTPVELFPLLNSFTNEALSQIVDQLESGGK